MAQPLELILQSPVQPQQQPKRIITTVALWFPAADANPAQTKRLPPLPVPPVLLRFCLLCNRHRVGPNYHLLLQYTPCILPIFPHSAELTDETSHHIIHTPWQSYESVHHNPKKVLEHLCRSDAKCGLTTWQLTTISPGLCAERVAVGPIEDPLQPP